MSIRWAARLTCSGATGAKRPLIKSWNLLWLRNNGTDAPSKEQPKSARTGTSFYWETQPPTPEQLKNADIFFQRHSPNLLFSSEKFRTVQQSPLPEVAFLGRSNVGKSSILNALTASKTFRTSSKPGRTKTMNFFSVGGEEENGNLGKLAVVDMPGYGKGSRQEWGPEIMKYLTQRKQLKRAFLLIDPLHGVKAQDAEILAFFRQQGVPHQVVLSKADRILYREGKTETKVQRGSSALDEIYEVVKKIIQPGTREGPEALGEIIACNADPPRGMKPFGIDNLRWAILVATGLSVKVGDPRLRRSIRETEPPESIESPGRPPVASDV